MKTTPLIFHKKNLENMEMNANYDLTLISADGLTKVLTKRSIMGKLSRHFAALIAQAPPEPMLKIILEDVSGETLRLLTELCGNKTSNVNEKNVAKIYVSAKQLEMNPTLYLLDGYAIMILNTKNCLKILKIAEDCCRSDVCKIVEKFISLHFGGICQTSTFMNLNAEQLNELLNTKMIQEQPAEYVFENMVLKWMYVDIFRRFSAFTMFLPNLRLAEMSANFVRDMVKPYCTSGQAKRIMYLALKARLNWKTLQLAQMRDRIIIVAKVYGKSHEIMHYITESKEFYLLGKLNSTIVNLSTIYAKALKGICFIVGDKETSMIKRFNLKTLKFNALVATAKPRSYAGISSLNYCNNVDGDILIIGSQKDSTTASTSVEYWSNIKGDWEILQSSPISTYGARFITIGHLIYCIGPRDNSFLCFNILVNSWSVLAPLNYARSFCGVVHENGMLYVIGGGSNVIECYDPNKNEWLRLSIVTNSELIRTCVRHYNRLFAFGSGILMFSDDNWVTWNTINSQDKLIYAAFSIPSSEF